ncbi:MAG: LemA family protein [Gammaproteobacteria bacterium]|nr:LemA family protein [Gammaproteobacteria bacterium]
MWLVPHINRFPVLDEEVNAKWSQVLNQYKRRSDLIPNLVATVQGYAKHERETLTAVVEARSKVAQMQLPKDILTNPQAFQQFQQHQGELTAALSKLMVVVERYPQLQASQNFSALQSQLEGTENRIAVARRDYIEVVKTFNISLRTIPGRWIAAVFYPQMEARQNFTITEAEQNTPKVEFK